MKSRLLLLVLLLVALQPKPAPASVIRVPDQWPTIQSGIDHANNGDTVSVWVHTVPPDTYYENVVFGSKGVFLVNRSFLPTGGTGYDSSWDHVVIDGRNLGQVVNMSGITDFLINSLTRREEYGIIPHEKTDDQTRLCCTGDEATRRRRFAQKGGYAN